eukprot:gene26697-17520_t
MRMAMKAGLKVIVDLHGAPCSQNGLDNSGNKSLDTNQDNWGETWLYKKDYWTYSSEPWACDRQKIAITENIACQYDGLLTFKSCTSLPVLTGEWSLAIDNCMPLLNGAPGVPNTRNNWNAGQCGRAADRLDSLWWTVHFQNLANRQIYTFEQQLGWTFWTYKLDDVVNKDPSAPMWSMSLAFDRGYITVPYGARYLGGCSSLEAVPECLEANTNKTLPTPMLQSDVRNLRGRYW